MPDTCPTVASSVADIAAYAGQTISARIAAGLPPDEQARLDAARAKIEAKRAEFEDVVETAETLEKQQRINYYNGNY